MGEDEEGSAFGAAEDQLEGALGNFDRPHRLPVGGVDEDLAVRYIDIARSVASDALAAAIGERPEVGQRAGVADQSRIGPVFRAVGDEDALAGAG